MKLFALIYTMVDIDESNRRRPEHVAFLADLVRSGRIECGWKFPHYEVGALQGILFCRAETADEVRGWFALDPVILAGARTIDVREALPMSVGVEPAPSGS
jgi:uncharacterized protein YciI